MTRHWLLISTFLLASGPIAHAQYYAPQAGAGAAPRTAQSPQPAAPGARMAPATQPAGNMPLRPVAAQQPVGQPAAPANQQAPPAGQFNGPPPGGPPVQIAPAPQPPLWAVNMNQEELDWLDRVLNFWEARSSKVRTFSCKFQCWEYNTYAPPGVAQKYSEGVIKYAQPDKGLFRVEKLSVYEPPQPAAPPPAKPTYVDQDKSLGEHWVCDGKQIFQFDARSRRVIITPLPLAMQGKAIADGPLPFMFGAKAQTIKARYWVRGLQGAPPGKYLLEAVPKSREDARNFKMVQILLDQAEYLPEMLQVFEPNATEQNRYRKTYQFTAREATDEKVGIAALNAILGAFQREFYEPQIPGGWKKELQADMVNVINPPAGQRPPQEAQRPAPPQKSFSPAMPR